MGDRGKDAGSRGVLTATGAAIRDRTAQGVEADGGDVHVFVEEEEAALPGGGATIVMGDAEFVGPLVEPIDGAGGFRREGNEARAGHGQEDCAEAAINVAHGEDFHAFPAAHIGHGGEVGGLKLQGEGGTEGFQILLVLSIHRNLLPVEIGTHAIGARIDDVCPEEAGRALIVASVDVEKGGDPIRRGPHELTAQGQFLIAFQHVLIDDAGGKVQIVHIIVTALEQAGDTVGESVRDRAADSAFHVHGVVSAPGHLAVGVKFFGGANAVKLDDTAGGVAAKQRALRSAQDFNLIHVEDREAFQDRALIGNTVIDQRDGLGGVEVKVGVAKAANVEAGEGPAERAFGNDRRHPGRQEADIHTTGGKRIEFLSGERGDGNRHVLEVFLDALGSHRDGAQAGFVVRGGRRLGRSRKAGT